jgi:thiamine kinase-like enzyme
VPLAGGITNRNYRVTLGGRDCVIRVPGKDTGLLEIDRRSERLANELAAKLGIAPGVVAFLEEPPCLVTEFVEGSAMEAADLRDPEIIGAVARVLRSLHSSGGSVPSEFSAFRIGEAYAALASERGTDVPPEVGDAMALAKEIEPQLTGAEHEPVPCHNDLLAANFIGTDDGVCVVDWEYAGMGDRYFDLANFAVNNELDADAQVMLLDEYFGSPGDRLVDLQLMMLVSDYREGMWGVAQAAVSDLDFDFDAYATEHLTRMLERAP